MAATNQHVIVIGEDEPTQGCRSYIDWPIGVGFRRFYCERMEPHDGVTALHEGLVAGASTNWSSLHEWAGEDRYTLWGGTHTS